MPPDLRSKRGSRRAWQDIAGNFADCQLEGAGHIVVQIVGEQNAVTITNAAALRLREYLGDIFASVPPNAARAGEPRYTTTGRRETRILVPYNRTSLPLQGRANLLSRLRDWRDAPDALSVHALIGGGGRRKIRLAVELTAEGRVQGWTAGFARQEDLDVCCCTAWDAKTCWSSATMSCCAADR